MKKYFLVITMVVSSIACYSQMVFEKGHFIDNSGQRIECLIRNLDWQNNPSEFEYKMSEDSASRKITISFAKEFGIGNIVKYKRASVSIDRSSEDIQLMSKDRNPIFQEEELYLKVLVEGKASLYFFREKNLIRYFYRMDSGEIKELVYKSYLISETRSGVNNQFRQQLSLDLKCADMSVHDFEDVGYNTKALERVFIKFNLCSNPNYVSVNEKPVRDAFNLNLRPGFNSSSLSIQRNGSPYADLGRHFTFRFGVQTEFILPYRQGSWTIIVEPTYQYFNFETSNPYVKVEYESIQLALGGRHYFFINENSKVFADVSFIFYDFALNSRMTFSPSYYLDIGANANFAIGVGYKHGERLSAALNYLTSTDLIGEYAYWASNYNTFAIIFGYTIF